MSSENEQRVIAPESNKLLCCPFDGGNAFYWQDTKWQDKHVVECEECGIQKRYEYSKEGVFKLWNTRSTSLQKIKEMDEDAALVAAAPELYEALEMMLEFPKAGPSTSTARAALAKARGEQP